MLYFDREIPNVPFEAKRCIFLQGPPGSGKDTIGGIIRKKFANPPQRCTLMKFSQPLKACVHAFFDIVDPKDTLEWKGTKNPAFAGYSPRDAYIAFSEEFAKPKFGEDIFGRLAAKRMAKLGGVGSLFVFTDSGFQAEAAPIIDWLKPDYCLAVHIRRPGASFSGDSRSYWTDERLVTLTIDNSVDLTLLEVAVEHAVRRWLRL